MLQEKGVDVSLVDEVSQVVSRRGSPWLLSKNARGVDLLELGLNFVDARGLPAPVYSFEDKVPGYAVFGW